METQNYNSFAIFFKNNKLSYCGQDCQRIPPSLWNMYGAKVNYLDLRSDFVKTGQVRVGLAQDSVLPHNIKSYNNIETLKGLEHFKKLEELILDNNRLSDSVTFPHLPYLKTLSLNNNQITDLDGFINKICENFPSLSYLSLLSNKACPNQLSDQEKDDTDYQRYRYYVLYKIQKLRFLDSRRVSSSERREAARRGEFARVRRGPPPSPPQGPPQLAPPRPLHLDLSAVGKHRGAYGKCHYKYTGKNSEGNRFILNSDL